MCQNVSKQIIHVHLQISWRDIAGLDEVITELKDTVILPVQKRHLFEGSRLLQPPKGKECDGKGVYPFYYIHLILKWITSLFLRCVAVWASRMWKNSYSQSYCQRGWIPLY